MLRPITTTVGSTLAALCLVSTLAMAQSPSSTPSQYPTQPMTPQIWQHHAATGPPAAAGPE
jgi:hypothetical protein